MKLNTLPYYAKLAFVLISLLSIGFIAILGKELLAPLVFSFLFCYVAFAIGPVFRNKVPLSEGFGLYDFGAFVYSVYCINRLYIRNASRKPFG